MLPGEAGWRRPLQLRRIAPCWYDLPGSPHIADHRDARIEVRVTDAARDPADRGSAKVSRFGGGERKRRRQVVTPQNLERWAIRHLDRFGSSAANLRRVLLRRLRRIEQAQQESFPLAPDWIDNTVAELRTRGYLDDRKYTILQVERMRARGSSARRIEHSLSEKGISRTLAREVIASAGGEGQELLAAVSYARRRGLGPFRLDPELRAEKRQCDLAALGRSGFPYEIARRIVEAPNVESLDSEVIALE